MLVGEVFARMGLDSKDYEKGLNKLEGYTEKKALTLGAVFKNAFSFALGIGLLSGFRSLGGAITDFVNTAARTEVLDIAMQSVARSSGYAISALQQQRKSVMELGIAEQEATQILTRFMQAQLDTADAAKLARVAQDAAVIAGYDSSQAAEQMTEAIAKQRPELLSAFGMTRNMNEIYKDYGKVVGKAATQLTEAEKKQAMLNYILAEGEKIAGTYEASMGAVGKQIGSLPRYWDTLKNAIAKPLALPAISVIVEALTNGLKSSIAWAEANKETLQRWGQTAANVAGFIVRGISWVTKAFIKNWGAIRFAATAFLTYVVAAKTINMVSFAVRGLTLLLWALRGHAFSTSGYFGILAASVRTYQAASLGAAGATNIFTYSVHAATAAVKGFLASIPVVGWILLALSAIVGGGVALWSKYSASVRAANDAAREAKMKELADQQLSAAKAAMKAAKGETKLGDAIGKAGKAATKTLMPFDEIHTIQKDMAGLGEIGDLDIPGFDMPAADMPGFDFDMGDFFSGIEDAKPTFKGFLGWIWDSIKSWGSGVKKWLLGWAGPLWDKVKESWGNFTAWAGDMWDAVKAKWGDFKTWCSETWQALWDPVKQKWSDFKTWAGNFWSVVKEKWNEFKVWAGNVWNAFWDPIRQKWNTFKSWAGELLAPVRQKWNSFFPWARGIWDDLLKKWNEIKRWSLWTWIKNKVDWLKNVFNFRWSLPKIKLPRFKVSWSTAGLWGSVGKFLGLPGKPIIDVTWLAKGGILTRPTLFGGGEAGPEAVIPLTGSVFDDLADRLAAALQKTQLAGAGAGGGGDIYVYIGNEQVDAYIHRSQDRRNIRSNGR